MFRSRLKFNQKHIEYERSKTFNRKCIRVRTNQWLKYLEFSIELEKR